MDFKNMLGTEQNWPNFFIVGTARAGTTSMYNYLKSTSGIFLIPKGEIHYFSPDVFYKENSRKKYLSLFENIKGKIIGEEAGYLHIIESPKLIKKTIPNAKIIICLRDPIERAFSHYLGGLRSHDETMAFEESFEKNMNPINKDSKFFKHYIKRGLYYENVKRFLEIFGDDNVQIIIFEGFIKRPREIFRETLDFLNVKSEIPPIVGKKFNEYAEPLRQLGTSLVKNETIKGIIKKILPKDSRVGLLRTLTNKKSVKPEMLDVHRKILEELYFNDSKKLKDLLKCDLPWTFLK